MVAALALGGSPVAGPPSHQGHFSHLFSANAGGRPPALPYENRYVVPEAPGSLAIGPNGNLFIADDSRDQVLELLPKGKFVVVVGDGDRGFSGDGGPALKADLDQPAGIAFGPGGALYVVDSGNNRVRRIAINGVITTVMGSPAPWKGPVANGTSALRARLVSPEDATFGPDGALYVADTGDNEVFRTGPDDKLVLVAGGPNVHYAGVYNMGQAATMASPDGPASIAFDPSGHLFIAGVNTKALLMVDPDGVIHAIIGQKPGTGFFPHATSGMVAAPNGQVLGLDGTSLVRITTTGVHTMVNFATDPLTRTWPAFLPNGIAVSPDGALYVATNGVSGYTPTPGIVEIAPDGKERVVWKGK